MKDFRESLSRTFHKNLSMVLKNNGRRKPKEGVFFTCDENKV